MSEIFFWNKWNKPFRFLYLALLLVFFISMVFTLYSWIWGSDALLSWEVLRIYKPLELSLDQLQILFSTISVPAEHYLVTEVFQGSNLIISPTGYVILGAGSLLFLALFVSILTTLSRFWYLFGMTVVAFALVGLRLEQLVLFDRTENIALYIGILIYFPLSYYFHSIKAETSFFSRLIYFVVATFVFGTIISVWSGVAHPLVYIGAYGIILPLAIFFLFVLLVAHDILSAFLFLITSGNSINSKNSLQHFLTVSVIYLGWILLTYLHSINSLRWDIIYLNPTVLLLISAVVGIWSFRDKCREILAFLPFAPSGAFVYLSMGSLSFLTLGLFYLTDNQPMLDMLDNYIMFAHLGVGLMFFLYVLANYYGVLQQNLNVYKILYRPKNLPYVITSIGGIIMIVVLVARAQLYPYYQGLSGYYNILGDVFMVEKQFFLSEQYYKLARSYEYRNHRSNYSLASLAMLQGDDAVALKYYNDALLKNPSEFAYINLSNIYSERGRFFDALFTLKEGLQKFPGSARLKNNLGVLFSQTSVADSAVYYLQRAALAPEVKENAAVNLLKLYTDLGVPVDKDSLKEHFQNLGYLPLQNNALVSLSQSGLPLSLDTDRIQVNRKKLDAETFTFWYEYALNQTQAANSQADVRLKEIAKR